eukprot:g4421.t1
MSARGHYWSHTPCKGNSPPARGSAATDAIGAEGAAGVPEAALTAAEQLWQAGSGAVWFQHIQQSGGHFVCGLARYNGVRDVNPLSLGGHVESTTTCGNPQLDYKLSSIDTATAKRLLDQLPALAREQPDAAKLIAFEGAEFPRPYNGVYAPEWSSVNFVGNEFTTLPHAPDRDSFVYLTLMRNPVERYISSVNSRIHPWFKDHGVCCKDGGQCNDCQGATFNTQALISAFREWGKEWLPAGPNIYINTYVGSDWGFYKDGSQVTQAMLEEAKRRLDSFSVVLVSDEDTLLGQLDYLSCLLGWRNPKGLSAYKKGANRMASTREKQKKRYPQQLLDAVAEANALDLELYEYALQLARARAKRRVPCVQGHTDGIAQRHAKELRTDATGELWDHANRKLNVKRQ